MCDVSWAHLVLVTFGGLQVSVSWGQHMRLLVWRPPPMWEVIHKASEPRSFPSVAPASFQSGPVTVSHGSEAILGQRWVMWSISPMVSKLQQFNFCTSWILVNIRNCVFTICQMCTFVSTPVLSFIFTYSFRLGISNFQWFSFAHIKSHQIYVLSSSFTYSFRLGVSNFQWFRFAHIESHQIYTYVQLLPAKKHLSMPLLYFISTYSSRMGLPKLSAVQFCTYRIPPNIRIFAIITC